MICQNIFVFMIIQIYKNRIWTLIHIVDKDNEVMCCQSDI